MWTNLSISCIYYTICHYNSFQDAPLAFSHKIFFVCMYAPEYVGCRHSFSPKYHRRKVNNTQSAKFWIKPSLMHNLLYQTIPNDNPIIHITYKKNQHILVWGYQHILVWKYQPCLGPKVTSEKTTIFKVIIRTVATLNL